MPEKTVHIMGCAHFDNYLYKENMPHEQLDTFYICI